ncbi:MAG: hypothetical protein COA79_01855 [Planctomycetota bacterium]|nr:MAG: hypothetical protein COA79_01855 [Planctomycetota bacterium]
MNLDNNEITSPSNEIKEFLKKHLTHLILLPLLGLTVFIAMHEGAHGVAVIAQGGTIDSFRWWPNNESLGMIHYSFQDGVTYSKFVISLAPYFLWISIVIITGIGSYYFKTNNFKLYSTIFIWFYLLPLVDIGHHALQYASGSSKINDFKSALGDPSLTGKLIIILTTISVIVVSYRVHKNLYQNNKLSIKPFTIMALITILILSIKL